MSIHASHVMNEAGWARWNGARPWLIGAGIVVTLLSVRWFVRGAESDGYGVLAVFVGFALAVFWGTISGLATWALAGIALFGSRDASPLARIGLGLAALGLVCAGLWRVGMVFGAFR